MSYSDDDNFDSIDIDIPKQHSTTPNHCVVSKAIEQPKLSIRTESDRVHKHAIVPRDHLSTATLISLLYDINPERVTAMVEIAAKYDMAVSPTLKGWNGIDSKLCVKLIHITCEWNSDRVRLPNRSGPVAMQGRIKPTLTPVDKVILLYYQAIWLHYQQCFGGNTCYILTVERNRYK